MCVSTHPALQNHFINKNVKYYNYTCEVGPSFPEKLIQGPVSAASARRPPSLCTGHLNYHDLILMI